MWWTPPSASLHSGAPTQSESTPVVDDIRVLITAGVLVPYISIYTVLAHDEAVEVIYLEFG